MKRYTRGFTLIELLVVIAIIGILASVVLVSLQSARKKGNDTRVISDVQQIRTMLETNFAGNAYPDLTGVALVITQPATAGTFKTLVDDLIAQQNAGGLTASFVAGAAGTVIVTKDASNPAKAYAIYAKVPSNSAAFCIDSTGKTMTAATFPTDPAVAPSVCQ